ncbi:cytochrome P450 oxidoreductase [Cadophora sp. MPI-SDFR-AT-0126]|nr:cytochrome P450 oxidoreductase [Leotiomycetes sp. MPI-SDFR-AT-0126]
MLLLFLRTILAAGVTYELGWILYCRYFHPLRSIPGPFLASFSRTWIVFMTASGSMEKTERALHKKHVGHLVRIAPNEVSCSDPEAIRIIYSTKKVFNKTDWYNTWTPPNLAYAGHFPTRDEKEHAERRRIVNNVYSMSSILESEGVIDSCTDQWCETVRELAKQKSVVDLRYLINMYIYEVLRGIIYSGTWNFANNRMEDAGWIEKIEPALALFSIGGTLPSYLMPIYMLSSIIFAPPIRRTMKFVGRLSLASAAAVSKRKEQIDANEDGKPDMVKRLFEINADRGEKYNFKHEHVVAETQSALFAGIDTTSIAITSILYYLMQSPDTYRKLTAEIDEAVEKGLISIPISYSDAVKLPYLKACINEGMRLHPSVALTMPREVSEGGATISGVYFPAGYRVGINPAVVQYDRDVFGVDAERFNPDRWLHGDTARMDRTMLEFGAGTRTCIGKNIALSEIYKLIPQLLRLFNIRLLEPDMELKTRNYWFNKQIGVRIQVEERDTTTS